MGDTFSLMVELEAAVNCGSSDRRVDILRRVTALFLSDTDRFSEQQVAVFDDVLVHLVKSIEAKALARLSDSLAPLKNAPIETVRHLANDDRIDVAWPVLSQSPRLLDGDLVAIARSKSAEHLLAISNRSVLSEPLTDVLVERGDARVANRLAKNMGARFSEAGYSLLVKKAELDSGLAEKLGLRLDIPLQLLKQLLHRATDMVRARLLAQTSSDKHAQIRAALANIAIEISEEVSGPQNFSSAEELVQTLNRDGKLNEQVLLNFVYARRYAESTSMLALLCGAPVDTLDRIMKNKRPDGLLVVCKAAQLSWTTVSAILKHRLAHLSISDEELGEAKRAFIALSQAAAQRTLRFILIQEPHRNAS